MTIEDRLQNPRLDQKIWDQDHLGRRQEAQLFAAFLDRQYRYLAAQGWERAYSIAVQGEYGLGKTTFLEGLAETLAHNHPVAWVNAWLDDTIDDPFISLIVVLERALAQMTKSSRLEKVKKASAEVVGALTKGALKKGLSLVTDSETASSVVQMLGEGGDGAIDALANSIAKGQKKDYEERAASIKALKLALRDALVEVDGDPSKHLPLFIFIDELDRCRPTYAIRMLETVKHLLDVPGLVFILGVQREQLAAAVQGQYGPKFDGHAYLRRFIDRSYDLQSVPLNKLCGHYLVKFGLPIGRLSAPPGMLSGEANLPIAATHIAEWVEYYGCTARDVVQVIDMLRTFVQFFEPKEHIELAWCIPLLMQQITHGKPDPLRLANGISKPADSTIKFSPKRTGSIVEARTALENYAGRSFDEIFQNSYPENPLHSWAYERLRAELDGMGHMSRDRSKMNDYARLVTIVAQLADTSQR